MLAAQESTQPKNTTSIILAFVFLVLGVALSYFGYVLGDISPNPNELLGSILFWSAIVYLLLAFPLGEATRNFSLYVRRPFVMGVFVCYLAIHLLLYGFLLEGILASIYGRNFFAVLPAFLITTNVFSPPSLSSAIFDLAYNPSIVVTIPPVFSAALSFYSISVALVIAVLVVASIGKTMEIGKLCTSARRARSFVFLPALGIVFGASCCLSVAGLISLVVPSAALLTSVIWAYYFTYFFFPAVAVVLLYLNLHSIEKISTGLRSSLPTPNGSS